jgi:hypothetical protein
MLPMPGAVSGGAENTEPAPDGGERADAFGNGSNGSNGTNAAPKPLSPEDAKSDGAQNGGETETTDNGFQKTESGEDLAGTDGTNGTNGDNNADGAGDSLATAAPSGGDGRSENTPLGETDDGPIVAAVPSPTPAPAQPIAPSPAPLGGGEIPTLPEGLKITSEEHGEGYSLYRVANEAGQELNVKVESADAPLGITGLLPITYQGVRVRVAIRADAITAVYEQDGQRYILTVPPDFEGPDDLIAQIFG